MVSRGAYVYLLTIDAEMNTGVLQGRQYRGGIDIAWYLSFQFCGRQISLIDYFDIIPPCKLTHDGLDVGIVEGEIAVLPTHNLFNVLITDYMDHR